MRYVWLLVYIIFLIGSKFLLDIKYEIAVEYVYRLIGKQVPIAVIEEYLTKGSFNNSRLLFIFFLFVLLNVVLIHRKKIKSLFVLLFKSGKKGFIEIVQTKIKDVKLLGKERISFILLLSVIVFFQLYQAWFRPLQYDEAWSYNYHIGNSFIASFAIPNNHFLYTIVAYFFDKLPFPNEFSIRLPLILAGFTSYLLIYYLLRQQFSINVSCVSSIFFYSSCAVTFYTLYARAYIFVLFFALLFLIAAYKWIESRFEKKELLVWVFISFVLGVYSVPTSLYFFFPSFLVIVYNVSKSNRPKLKSIVFGGFISFAIIIILYFPILFSSHIDNLVAAGSSERKLNLNFLHNYTVYNEDFHFGLKKFNGSL